MSGGDIHPTLGQITAIIRGLAECADPTVLVGGLQQIVNLAQHGLRAVGLAEHHAGTWAADGFLSAKRWLCHHTGLSAGAAGSTLHQAEHLTAMPHTAAASAAGVLSETRLRLLVSCHAADPELYDEDTDRMFNQIVDDRELAVAARRWIDAAKDRNGKPPRGPEFGFWLSETLDGTWRLDGTLAPGDGKLLDEAIQQHLRPMLAARHGGDPLTVAELRAQCLVDIADRDLREPLPAKARNNRHRINLIVHRNDDGTITADPDFPAEAWCDATFIRMILNADSEPLDVGRATRNWPDPIANAIYTRDRHCQFPGCDIAANRCDIHHRTEWQHGGTTSTDNGLLLCRRHHRFIHTNHWTIDPGQHGPPVFRPPDGTSYRPPPSRAPTSRTG